MKLWIFQEVKDGPQFDFLRPGVWGYPEVKDGTIPRILHTRTSESQGAVVLECLTHIPKILAAGWRITRENAPI